MSNFVTKYLKYKYLNLKNNITGGGVKTSNSPKTHEMKLAKKWFNYVKKGKKTIEGRVLDEKRKLLDVGDFIIFTNNDNKKQTVKTEITLLEEIREPTSFEEAINKDNYKQLIPSAKNIGEAVEVYDKIGEYKEGAEEHGIILIHLKLVKKNKKKFI